MYEVAGKIECGYGMRFAMAICGVGIMLGGKGEVRDWEGEG